MKIYLNVPFYGRKIADVMETFHRFESIANTVFPNKSIEIVNIPVFDETFEKVGINKFLVEQLALLSSVDVVLSMECCYNDPVCNMINETFLALKDTERRLKSDKKVSEEECDCNRYMQHMYRPVYYFAEDLIYTEHELIERQKSYDRHCNCKEDMDVCGCQPNY